jgi:hypothetical protein
VTPTFVVLFGNEKCGSECPSPSINTNLMVAMKEEEAIYKNK